MIAVHILEDNVFTAHFISRCVRTNQCFKSSIRMEHTQQCQLSLSYTVDLVCQSETLVSSDVATHTYPEL